MSDDKKTEQNSSKIKQISTFLKGKCGSLNLYAIPNFVKSDGSALKIIWLSYILLASAGCAYYVTLCLISYFSYSVVTNVQVVPEKSLMFPIITICNLNPFATDIGLKYLNEVYVGENTRDEAYTWKILFGAKYSNYLTNYQNNLFGFKLNETVLRCSFGAPCDLENDFESFYDTNFGNCFRFNYKKEKKVVKADQYSGLSLDLFIGSASTNQNDFLAMSGLIVLINDEKKDSPQNDNGVLIMPGISNRIKINKYFVIKQPQPYSQCLNGLTSADSYGSYEYKKTISVSLSSYTHKLCFLVCIEKYVKDECGCDVGYINIHVDENTRLCVNSSNKTQYEINTNCAIQKYYQYLISPLMPCDCPFECQTIDYTFTTSNAEFPTKKYAEYLAKNQLILSKFSNYSNITYDLIKQNVARVEISYDSMQHIKIREYPTFSLSDLVSNLGGLFGLFLGLNFTIFIDAIEILFCICRIIVKKNRVEDKNENIEINKNKIKYSMTKDLVVIEYEDATSSNHKSIEKGVTRQQTF